MTVNPTRTRELDIAKLSLRAWQLAGQASEYQVLDEPQGQFARDMLELIVNALQMEGIMLRALDFETVQLELWEDTVVLPNTVYRAVGSAMYIPAGQDPDAANAELVIEPITVQAMQTISSKGAIAPPTKYTQRIVNGLVQIEFWPRPSEAGYARFQVHRLLGDNNDAAATPDVDHGCAAYLLWELSHYIANAKTMPLQRCAWLAGQASKHKSALQLSSSEKAPSEITIAHSTYWSR